jgi:alkyl sulfatase BDS1-like metallo-beta-lactamase superfamily hydrolase
VIKVTEGIYVAIGYGLANSIMIEGETGLIIGSTSPHTSSLYWTLTLFLQWIAWKVILLQMTS